MFILQKMFRLKSSIFCKLSIFFIKKHYILSKKCSKICFYTSKHAEIKSKVFWKNWKLWKKKNSIFWSSILECARGLKPWFARPHSMILRANKTSTWYLASEWNTFSIEIARMIYIKKKCKMSPKSEVPDAAKKP